jgi:hypothetical protein
MVSLVSAMAVEAKAANMKAPKAPVKTGFIEFLPMHFVELLPTKRAYTHS